MKTAKRLVLVGCLAIAALAHADEIVRHRIPDSDFPIAAAVEVPAGKTTVFLSGAGPGIADRSAPPESVAAYGDTRTQTISALTAIRATLQRLHLDMGNVVKMQVFLVGDPAQGGKMDFAGFMEGYRQFFGTAQQPNLPARSTMRVAGLVAPGWLIEIEVTAVRD